MKKLTQAQREKLNSIKPLLDDIDLSTDYKPSMIGSYKPVGAPGSKGADFAMKLLVLRDRGVIDDGEYKAFVLHQTKEPDDALGETTRDVLASLTPREAKVLRQRFGIDFDTDHTFEEVGKQFDITRERIRQIEAKALKKLRDPKSRKPPDPDSDEDDSD